MNCADCLLRRRFRLRLAFIFRIFVFADAEDLLQEVSLLRLGWLLGVGSVAVGRRVGSLTDDRGTG